MRAFAPSCLVLLALLAAGSAPATAAPPVSGVYSEEKQSRALAKTGFDLVRRPFTWKLIEPRPGKFNWASYDGIVGAAAQRGLTLFPFLLDPPPWAVTKPTERGMRPPRRPKDFARFATAVVKRYGPRGSYWPANPYIPFKPIRAWQIWNEPNLPAFWQPRPDARAYVKLLRPAAQAIHKADRQATVVAAGLPESRQGVPQLDYLKAMYRAKAEGAADALAIHAYAPDAAGVIALVSQFRSAMTARRDKTPLWVTEFGWADGGEDSLFTVSAKEQAQLLSQAVTGLRALSRPLGLGGLFLFRWRDPSERVLDIDIWPYHAGLVTTKGKKKPALKAVRKALAKPVPRGAAKPGRLTLDVVQTGRRAVRARCSRKCTFGLSVIESVPREARGDLERVLIRSRAVGRTATFRTPVLAGRELLVSAYTADGAADRFSLSSPRTDRR
ncbi:MAG: glycosyl hydrolase [Solirubrobacteraceae bacterium]